jgi:predicted kinase
MFTSFETIIDTVQGAQKSFVETYVKDKTIQTELVKLTEAQAKFAKGSYQTSLSLAQAVYKTATEAVQAKKGV